MKKRQTPISTKRLQFERLEERTPLAGDVSFNFSGNDLKITGTNDGNQIRVTSSLINNTVTVLAINSTSVGGGFAQKVLPIPNGGIRNVVIDMKKTSDPQSIDPLRHFDAVELSNMSIAGKLTIKSTGALDLQVFNVAAQSATSFKASTGNISGNQGSRFDIRGGQYGVPLSGGATSKLGAVTITTGKSNDTIAVNDARVGNLTISSSAGNDEITVGANGQLNNLDGMGTLTIKTSTGDDDVTIGQISTTRSTEFVGDVLVDLGTGVDRVASLGSLQFFGGNAFESNTEFNGKFTVKGSAGNKSVGFAGVKVVKDVSVTTGSGVDLIAGAEVAMFGKLTINSGSGDDVIAIGQQPGFTVDNFVGLKTTINAGAGNDRILSDDTTFNGEVVINGNGGLDEVLALSSIFNAKVTADGGTLAEGNLGDDSGCTFNGPKIFKDFSGFVNDSALLVAIDAIVDARFGDLI